MEKINKEKKEEIKKIINKFKPLMRNPKFPNINDLDIPELNIGIELECIVNRDGLDLNVGDYHNANPFTEIWRAERDGSLYGSNHFYRGYCVELTTEIIDIDDYKKAINELRQYVGNELLKDVFWFNESCGCHIHFSAKNKKKFYKNIPLCVYPLIRKFFFNELDKSSIIPQDTKELIKKHYYRHYAQKFKKLHLISNNRYLEFNFRSEKQGMGLEWRSFNVRGVETWEELEEMFRIGTDTIKYLASVLNNFYYEDKKSIKEKEINENIIKNEEIEIDREDIFGSDKTPFNLNQENMIKDVIFFEKNETKLFKYMVY